MENCAPIVRGRLASLERFQYALYAIALSATDLNIFHSMRRQKFGFEFRSNHTPSALKKKEQYKLGDCQYYLFFFFYDVLFYCKCGSFNFLVANVHLLQAERNLYKNIFEFLKISKMLYCVQVRLFFSRFVRLLGVCPRAQFLRRGTARAPTCPLSLSTNDCARSAASSSRVTSVIFMFP